MASRINVHIETDVPLELHMSVGGAGLNPSRVEVQANTFGLCAGHLSLDLPDSQEDALKIATDSQTTVALSEWPECPATPPSQESLTKSEWPFRCEAPASPHNPEVSTPLKKHSGKGAFDMQSESELVQPEVQPEPEHATPGSERPHWSACNTPLSSPEGPHWSACNTPLSGPKRKKQRLVLPSVEPTRTPPLLPLVLVRG